jgi:hypothetical protein
LQVQAHHEEQLQQRLQEFDQLVNAAEVAHLLITAVSRMHNTVVLQLCALPAAAHVSSATMKQLRQRCLAHMPQTASALQKLLQLATPAAAAGSRHCAVIQQNNCIKPLQATATAASPPPAAGNCGVAPTVENLDRQPAAG